MPFSLFSFHENPRYWRERKNGGGSCRRPRDAKGASMEGPEGLDKEVEVEEDDVS